MFGSLGLACRQIMRSSLHLGQESHKIRLISVVCLELHVTIVSIVMAKSYLNLCFMYVSCEIMVLLLKQLIFFNFTCDRCLNYCQENVYDYIAFHMMQ